MLVRKKKSPKFIDATKINPFMAWVRNRIRRNKNIIFIINGETGCLDGDTQINVNRTDMGRRYTLKQMYNNFRQNPSKNLKMWNLNEPTFVRSFDGKSIRLHKILDVVYSGKKELFLLTLENGKNIKATKDHKIMTSNGFVEMQNLTITHEVMCDTLHPQKGKQRSFKLRDIEIKTLFHPFATHNGVAVHRLTYESYLNNLSFREYLDILWNDESVAKTLKYIDTDLYEIHHKDGNHYNNSLDNLEVLPTSEHKLKHIDYYNFNQGIPGYSKVVSITSIGIKDTYDLICEEPHHNFVANGIVVHNSGKTYSAIELARRISIMLGSHFTIQDNMDFNFIELLKKTRLKQNKKAGTCFLFEEVGSVSSGAASRTWQSQANSFFLSFMQTTRHRRQILIMTCPDFAFLDASARKLIHLQAEMVGIDTNKKVAKLKVYRLQKNLKDGKIYFKFIRYRLGTKIYKMKLLCVPKPPKLVCEDYEKLKTEYTSKLNDMILKSNEPKEAYKSKTKVPMDDFKKSWLEEGLTDAALCRKYNIGFTTCQGYKRLLKGEAKLDGVDLVKMIRKQNEIEVDIDFKMPTSHKSA